MPPWGLQGTLRVLLVLLHDFPEFLCQYHFPLCDCIPPPCIQVRHFRRPITGPLAKSTLGQCRPPAFVPIVEDEECVCFSTQPAHAKQSLRSMSYSVEHLPMLINC